MPEHSQSIMPEQCDGICHVVNARTHSRRSGQISDFVSPNASRAGGQTSFISAGVEYGVRWRSKHDEFIAGSYGSNPSGAESMVERCGDPKKFSPHAAEVVCRDVSEWRSAGEVVS